MKNKIILLLLCFVLLFGAFSITAFAASEEIQYYISSFTFSDSVANTNGFNGTIEGSIFFDEREFVSITSGYVSVCFTSADHSTKNYYKDGLANKTFVFTNGYTLVPESFYNWALANSSTFDGKSVIAHDCDYVSVITPVTCITDGYTTFTCSICNDMYIGDEVPALGHNYSSVVTAPTCLSAGYTTFTCLSCGDSYVGDETGVSPHTYQTTVTDATCTKPGFTTHTCTSCGDTYTDSEAAVLPHDYLTVVTNPTCTTSGYSTHTCRACGFVMIDSETSPLSHAYKSVVTSPTVSKKGYTTHTCTLCGDSFVDSWVDEIPSHEDTLISAWGEIFNDFLSLFGSAQSIFYDGSGLTLIGGLALLGFILGLGFVLFLVIEKFLHFRW